MARTRSAPLGARPNTRRNACSYSATGAIRTTAASRLGWPISVGFNDGKSRLFLKSLRAPIPELHRVVESVQYRRSVALGRRRRTRCLDRNAALLERLGARQRTVKRNGPRTSLCLWGCFEFLIS